MARSRSSRPRGGRVANAPRVNATRPYVGYNVYIGKPRVPRLSPPPVSPLTVYEDRRRFHPLAFARPAHAFQRSASRLVVPKPVRRVRSLPSRVAFAVPNKVLICLRRNIRKEVLHAKGVAGSKGLRRPKRNQFSEVKC